MTRVDEAVRKCVCFVGYQLDDEPRFSASGFLVAFDSGSRLVVTARHVIVGLQAKRPNLPIAVWLNRDGGGRAVINTKPQDWLFHPSDDQVDAAVLAMPIPAEGFDHLAITRKMFAEDELIREYNVGVGDELYFPGLFVPHGGRDRNRPIVRQGTIAAMREEPVDTDMGPIDAYLAEVRSIGGLSGSPVFLHLSDLWRDPPGNDPGDPIPTQHEDVFFGLVHGHYDAKSPLTSPLDLEAVNMGISMVIPAQRIREVIEQEEIEMVRKKKEPRESPAVMDASFADAEIDSEYGRSRADPAPDARARSHLPGASRMQRVHHH